MSSRSYRDETGHCDCCSDESDSCVCYLLLCWEGEHLMHGEDDGMDRLIDWGCRLALQAAPPAFDCSVLKVLPIHLAKSIEHRFLEVASRCGSIEHTDEDVDELRYLLDECGECRKGIYADWVNASALDVGEQNDTHEDETMHEDEEKNDGAGDMQMEKGGQHQDDSMRHWHVNDELLPHWKLQSLFPGEAVIVLHIISPS